jgi:chemotaxis protein methyltransferase CheR
MKLSNQQFERTRWLASKLAGIELVERHRELLRRRSQRIGIGDDAGLDALLDAVEAGQTMATQKLLGLLTTKFTGFFRHPQHFAIAAQHALRAADQRDQARLWCAGTATGEEAWSLAMTLIESFQREDPPVSIFATDVETEALAVAQLGQYARAAVTGLDAGRRERFFIATNDASRCQVTSSVHRLVDFRALNLVSSDWPIAGPFDVIFCRNVLMYLEAHHRYAVLERMATLLAPDGLLMLDPTEHLAAAGRLFVPRAAGVYSLRGSGDSGERRQSAPAESAALCRVAATKVNS